MLRMWKTDFLFSNYEEKGLTGVAQVVGCHPAKESWWARLLGRTHTLGAGLAPGRGVCEGQSIDLSLAHWCFFPSLPPSFSIWLKKINLLKTYGEKIAWGRPSYIRNWIFFMKYFYIKPFLIFILLQLSQIFLLCSPLPIQPSKP